MKGLTIPRRVSSCWRSVLLAACAALALLMLAPALPAAAGDPSKLDQPAASLAPVSTQNGFLRADVLPSRNGAFATGTTGGDPSTPNDDNKSLLFWFRANGVTEYATSKATLRLMSDATPADTALFNTTPSVAPAPAGGGVVTEWLVSGVRVTQKLVLVTNPYSGRNDTTRIEYTLTNTTGEAKTAGLRLMLDVMIGDNDGAPYFVPGAGNLTTEREFLAGAVPPYWRAFESATFDPAMLKGQGIITGRGATTPDRFVIARYWGIGGTLWDYSVNTSTALGDSAVALYWNPAALAAGASRTYVTFYGLAGEGGGQTWMDGPAALTCDQLQFTVTQWIVNNSTSTWTDGTTTIQLPAGISLAAGESATKTFHNPGPGEARSATWSLLAQPDVIPVTRTLSARATFTNLPESLEATKQVGIPTCATPTPTRTNTPTATHTRTVTPTRTSTATRTATRTITPGGATLTPTRTPAGPTWTPTRTTTSQFTATFTSTPTRTATGPTMTPTVTQTPRPPKIRGPETLHRGPMKWLNVGGGNVPTLTTCNQMLVYAVEMPISGTAPISIELWDDRSRRSGSLAQSPVDPSKWDGIGTSTGIFGEAFPQTFHIRKVIRYDDGEVITHDVLTHIELCGDPSGYVYDAGAPDVRLQDAVVTLFRRDGGVDAPWNAAEYDQINPQITDPQGRYGWMTTAGTYFVQVAKRCYQDTTSRVVTVPPEVRDLHVGMEPIGCSPVRVLSADAYDAGNNLLQRAMPGAPVRLRGVVNNSSAGPITAQISVQVMDPSGQAVAGLSQSGARSLAPGENLVTLEGLLPITPEGNYRFLVQATHNQQTTYQMVYFMMRMYRADLPVILKGARLGDVRTPTSTPPGTPGQTATATSVQPASATPTRTATRTASATSTATATATTGPTATRTHTPTATATSLPGWQTILSEGFEGDFPGPWLTMGEPTWGQTDCRAAGGTHSVWVAAAGEGALRPCLDDYPDGAFAWLTYGPFDLSDATAAVVTFQRWQRSETDVDLLWWMVSTDDMNYWGVYASGDSGGWVTETLDLGDVPDLGSMLGEPQVYFTFVFEANDSITDAGVFLDNVEIRKQVGGAPPATGRAPAGPPARTRL